MLQDMGLRELLRKLRPGSLERGDYTSGSQRPVDNLDAWTAAQSGDFDRTSGGEGRGSIPPNYVKSYDEGRPRK
jgi:hypothetical protein